MPGLSDRRALTQAIYDSFVVTSATEARLAARGTHDTDSAIRLREYELKLFQLHDPKLYEAMRKTAATALEKKYSGNHYVYIFHEFMCSKMYVKDFVSENQNKEVKEAHNIVSKLLHIKMPEGMAWDAKDQLPMGLGKSQARYNMTRTIYDHLKQLHSESGASRGTLQGLNTSNPLDHHFKEAVDAWVQQTKKKSQGEVKYRHCAASVKIGGGYTMIMARVSDLIYLKIRNSIQNIELLFTAMHFSRCLDFLKKLGNIDLGLTLSYNMESNQHHTDPAREAIRLISHMAKMGVRDDLAPGEAGKALSDLFKARLSQTPELPWNNFNMLLGTYDDKRGRNAERLWDIFCDNHSDDDILMNISYVWKTCPQPDSDIREDFHAMFGGVSSPNPISDQAAEMMELSFRRSYLVGLLRERRIPHVQSTTGRPIDKVLLSVIQKSSVNDSDLRKVTFAMMRGVKVFAHDVFPKVSDTSHLGFKDKSSSVTGPKIRAQVSKMEKIEVDIIELEDRLLAEALDGRVEDLLAAVKHNHDIEHVGKLIQSTANDIITSLNEDIGEIFKEAEEKYKSIVESLNGISGHYGDPDFPKMLSDWAKENPELQVNTGTEPKLGEVHKKTVRIFFMFEKGMKTFLSQFERMSRIMDYYIRGAEIVKGDRAREKHMNILSSAYKSSSRGILAYQILFDLSKFSQRFNHRIIDAAAKVIGEATDYPHYGSISCLFKASYLYVSARFIDAHHIGVLGAFEGFLNFLWTGIHACVMDLALRECGRSGDLAAYSDDGLLMFTMRSTLESPHSEIRAELESVVNSIVKTYKDYGLDFNLGKTLISRTLAEFLGVIQYKGKRLPTWMKELCKLGIADENVLIKSASQEINDTSSQMTALIKGGMNPYAASYIGYMEILMGPCRKVKNAIHGLIKDFDAQNDKNMREKALIAFLCLPASYGGARIPDPLTMMMTADYDPISEMIQDLKQFIEIFPDSSGIMYILEDAIKATDDYTSIFMGASPVHTFGHAYDSSLIKSMIAKKLQGKIDTFVEHPLSRAKVPDLHVALENMDNISVPIVSALSRYILPMIEYSRVIAPTKSSSLAKLLKKHEIREIQRADSTAMKNSIRRMMVYLCVKSDSDLPTAHELYTRSFPALSFAPPIPSYRALATITKVADPHHYEYVVAKHSKEKVSGSDRLENTQYSDDITPPLVSSDVNMRHLTSAPDVPSHCMRALFSEVVSAASSGHDIVELANVICDINNTPKVPGDLLATMAAIRKLSVANKKKSTHRVYWSNATRSSGILSRSAALNVVMVLVGEMHYSMIITVATAMVHLKLKCTRADAYPTRILVNIDRDLAISTRYTISMSRKTPMIYEQEERESKYLKSVSSTFTAVKTEMRRTVEGLRLELADSLIIGRLCMIPSFRKHDPHSFVVDPVRFSMVWTLINKLDSFVEDKSGSAGVRPAKLEQAPLNQLPIEMCDLAILYRVYRKVRKSEIKNWLRGKVNYCVVPEEVVDNTLAAARELGVIHSVTKVHLLSQSAARTYMTILKAQEYDIIYYGLDSTSEDIHSGVVSHPRARAAGKVIDKIITDHFDQKIYTAEVDTTRLVMKIFRGLVRGSVHRKEPYNPGAVKQWIKYFTLIIDAACRIMPEKYRTKLFSRKTLEDKYRPIPKEELGFLKNLYKHPKIPRPTLGHIDTMDQAITYVENIATYGMLIPVYRKLVEKGYDKWYEDVHIKILLPTMAFIRTTSYSVYEDSLQARTRLRQDPETVPRVTGIERLMERLAKPYVDWQGNNQHYTTSMLLNAEPQTRYREPGKERLNYELSYDVRGGSSHMIPPLLMYSMGLPTLFAAGKSSVSCVRDILHPQEPAYQEAIERIIRENSMEVGDDYTAPQMLLFYGMGEYELKESLKENFKDLRREAIAVVEIPPVASVCSVGIIKWLTSSKYAYLTVGMSSDLKGVSLYVISLTYSPYPFSDGEEHIDFSGEEVLDFGYESIMPVMDAINKGAIDSLVAIGLTPMHQCGLPVAMRIYDSLGEVNYKVAEELIDRTSVSFVQTGRPSEALVALSQENPLKSAYLQKAILCKCVDEFYYPAAVSAAAYYYASLFTDLSPQGLFDMFWEALLRIDENEKKCYALRVMLDPLISINHPPPSSMSPMSQLMADDLGHLKHPRMNYSGYLDLDAKSLLAISGQSLISHLKQGVLISYFRDNGLDGTKLELDRLLDPPPGTFDMVKIKERIFNPGQVVRKASQYGLTAIVEEHNSEVGVRIDGPPPIRIDKMLQPALNEMRNQQVEEDKKKREKEEQDKKRREREEQEKRDKLLADVRAMEIERPELTREEADIQMTLYDRLEANGYSDYVDRLIVDIPKEEHKKLLSLDGCDLYMSVSRWITAYEEEEENASAPPVGVMSYKPPRYEDL